MSRTSRRNRSRCAMGRSPATRGIQWVSCRGRCRRASSRCSADRGTRWSSSPRHRSCTPLRWCTIRALRRCHHGRHRSRRHTPDCHRCSGPSHSGHRMSSTDRTRCTPKRRSRLWNRSPSCTSRPRSRRGAHLRPCRPHVGRGTRAAPIRSGPGVFRSGFFDW